MGKAAKKSEDAPVRAKGHKHVRADLLKVSKSVKIAAAMGSLNGHSFRNTIRIMGEAEDNYKRYGRLILGGKAE